MSYLFITSTKNKRNTFHVSSLSTKWFHITLASCCCYQNCAQTFPPLCVLCRETSSAKHWVLGKYHLKHALLLLLCTVPHSLGLYRAVKLWGLYPTHNPPGLSFCLARFSLFLDRNKKHPVNRQSEALLPSLAQPFSSDVLQCRRQSRYSPF